MRVHIGKIWQSKHEFSINGKMRKAKVQIASHRHTTKLKFDLRFRLDLSGVSKPYILVSKSKAKIKSIIRAIDDQKRKLGPAYKTM